MAKVAEWPNRDPALRPAVSARPGANFSTNSKEECRDGEKSALQLSRCTQIDFALDSEVATD